MLTDTQLDNYADVLLWGLKKSRIGKYRKNNIVMVRYDLAALRLAEILQTKLLYLGINPVLRMNTTPRMELDFFSIANPAQLVFQAPGNKELCRHLNGSIFLNAPELLTHLSAIDPRKIGKTALAMKPLRDIVNTREAAGAFGWTLCMVPTRELAKQAKLSCKEYTAQLIKACYLNKPHPVKEWETLFTRALSIKKWLNSMRVRSYRIESDSTDLTVTPGERRKWIGISGHNIPSFEIFLSPDWRGTKGTYYANLPSFRSGNYVEGVRLEFKNGSACMITAKVNKDFVVKQLTMDKGANKVGEFSLTDKRFSKIDKFMANTLFDENHGGAYGNCHLALGASYADTYDGSPAELTPRKKKQLGFNDSALHWDLVNTEKKTVTACLHSGKKVIIYEDGKFRF